MKEFDISSKPTTIFGKPFRVIDYNNPPEKAPMTCPKCKESIEFEEQKFIEKASWGDLFTLMVFGIPRDKLTTKDAIEAGRFIHQLRDSDGKVLKLEDAEYTWIKETVDKYGATQVFGVNAAVLVAFLEDFKRLHDSKERKDAE